MRTSRLLACLIALASFVACTSAPRPPSERALGFVRRAGTKLVADGASYRFRGLNYYDINALAGENPLHPGTRMLLGCRFHLQVPPIEESIGRIGSAANALRAWFFQPFATAIPLGGSSPQRDWSLFDRTLAAVKRARMRIVVTFADQFGQCDLPKGHMKTLEWYRSGYRTEVPPHELQSYRAYVHDVVSRYRDRPEILAWQLVSEATVVNEDGKTCDEPAAAKGLRSFADDVGGLIKSLDPNHLVSIGTGRTACGLLGPAMTDYRYVFASPAVDLCEYHDYYDPGTPIPQILATELDICGKALDKPMFVGETGITASDAAALCRAPARFPACRARLLEAKFLAQFDAAARGFGEDVVGELVWDWCESAWTRCEPRMFDIVPGDPVLAALAALPTS